MTVASGKRLEEKQMKSEGLFNRAVGRNPRNRKDWVGLPTLLICLLALHTGCVTVAGRDLQTRVPGESPAVTRTLPPGDSLATAPSPIVVHVSSIQESDSGALELKVRTDRRCDILETTPMIDILNERRKNNAGWLKWAAAGVFLGGGAGLYFDAHNNLAPESPATSSGEITRERGEVAAYGMLGVGLAFAVWATVDQFRSADRVVFQPGLVLGAASTLFLRQTAIFSGTHNIIS